MVTHHRSVLNIVVLLSVSSSGDYMASRGCHSVSLVRLTSTDIVHMGGGFIPEHLLGCIDPRASNYDPSKAAGSVDNGGCEYECGALDNNARSAGNPAGNQTAQCLIYNRELAEREPRPPHGETEI